MMKQREENKMIDLTDIKKMQAELDARLEEIQKELDARLEEIQKGLEIPECWEDGQSTMQQPTACTMGEYGCILLRLPTWSCTGSRDSLNRTHPYKPMETRTA